MELVLQRDDHLRVTLEGLAFTLEGLLRSEGHGRRDHAIDGVGPDRVVDERMIGHVLETLIERLVVGQGVGADGDARARGTRGTRGTRGACARARAGDQEGVEDGNRLDRRLGDELSHDAGDLGSMAVGDRG